MPLKSTPLEEPFVNMTSLIDVLLVLLLYFMAAARLIEIEYQFEVEVPSVASAPALTGGPDPVSVNVLADGTVLVGDVPHSLPELRAALESARENFADQEVVIRGARRADYQYIAEVMSACHEARIHTIRQSVLLEEAAP